MNKEYLENMETLIKRGNTSNFIQSVYDHYEEEGFISDSQKDVLDRIFEEEGL